MSGDDGLHLVYLFLLILFVGSNLIARRLPTGRMVRLALLWIAIFGTAVLLFSLISGY
jgi:aspartyl protease family protein